MFRFFFSVACLAVAALGAGAAQAEYPDRPLRIVAPYPPGGATDMLARVVAERLHQAWGQPVVVENRPGASGVIGAENVSRSEPDGYTMVVGAVSLHAILPSLLKNMHEAQDRLAPVATLANLPSYVVVPANHPAKSIQDLIAMIKQDGTKYAYASAGMGTSQHVFPELFKQQAGIDMLHVPYKGSGAMIVDLLAERVDMVIEQGPAVLKHIEAGTLRALAATTKERTREQPDVPTLDETVLPGFEANTWFAVYVPKGTPPEVIRKLNEQINRSLQQPEVVERLSMHGAIPLLSTPEQLAELEQRDTEKWLQVIKAGNISID